MDKLDKYKNNLLALQAWQEGYEEGLLQCEVGGRTTWLAVTLVLSVFLLLALSGCSDQYRYPCQDPANQTKAHCTPPECEADGTCTEYLVEKHK